MVSRRRLIQQSVAGLGGSLAGCVATQDVASNNRMPQNHYVEAAPLSRSYNPPPGLDLSGEGYCPIRYAGDARLYYWDTGGPGPVILLAHVGTGSAHVWGYQQQVFRDAGYRVVAWSRRGYRGSDTGPIDESGNALPASGRPLDDIEALVRYLGIERFHLLGHAAGGGIANGYIREYPQRILSSISVAALQSISEPDWSQPMNSIREPGGAGVVGSFNSNPAHIRELGPSYRWANPEGTAAWMELEHGNRPVTVNHAEGVTVTWQDMEARTFPTLLVGGDADLYVPPSMYRYLQTRVPDCELAIVPEAGHSVCWEQPVVFNRIVLDFLARQG
jgi:non-heme chloroperoxidase